MTDDDLIRRGDALKSIEAALNNATGDLYDAYSAIAAITAVTKPALTRVGSGLYEVPPAVIAPQGVRDFEVEVVRGVEGAALYFNNYRVAGSKPWGGGTLLHTFKVKWSDVKSSGILAPAQPAPSDWRSTTTKTEDGYNG